jgi:hypothetical protein
MLGPNQGRQQARREDTSVARIIRLVLSIVAVAAGTSMLAVGSVPNAAGAGVVVASPTATDTPMDTPLPCNFVIASVGTFDGVVATCTPVQIVHTATPTFTATVLATDTPAPPPPTPRLRIHSSRARRARPAAAAPASWRPTRAPDGYRVPRSVCRHSGIG